MAGYMVDSRRDVSTPYSLHEQRIVRGVGMPRSVGCLGLVMRCFAVCFALFGVVLAVISSAAGALLGGAGGLAIGLVVGGGFGFLLCVAALSLWARTRIMERWSGGTVGVYPVGAPQPPYYDTDLRW